MRRQWKAERFDEVAVHSEADAQPVVEWLDVDVRRSVTQRLAHDASHQLHHGGLVVEADRRNRLGFLTLDVFGVERAEDLVEVRGRAVHLLDHRRDRCVVGRLPDEALAGGGLDDLTARR